MFRLARRQHAWLLLSSTASAPEAGGVYFGRPATVQYSLRLPDTGPRTLDHLYTTEATETLNVLRDQIRIASEGEEPGP